MAKRTRSNRSAHRPGGQGPSRSRRSSGAETSAPTSPEADISGAEEIGASYAEVEVDEIAAAAVAEATGTNASESPAGDEPVPGRRARRRAHGRGPRKSRDELASRAAAEDAWVREDLRRIGVVSVVLIASLAAAYIVFGLMDVLGLY